MRNLDPSPQIDVYRTRYGYSYVSTRKISEEVRYMRSAKKGNQWYFGMMAHIGVDARSGLVHTAGVTAVACTMRR